MHMRLAVRGLAPTAKLRRSFGAGNHGPILVQRAVSVLQGNTPDTLAARVFDAECEAYPRSDPAVCRGHVENRERPIADWITDVP